MRILLVEDDLEMAHAIRATVKDRFAIEVVHTGEEGLFHIENYAYDLIILDLNLPDMTGIDICCRIRSTGLTTPVLMLTGSQELDDKVRCLDAGADDFLSKPFAKAELHARLRALSRRSRMQLETSLFCVNDLAVDSSTGIAFHRGTPLNLRRKEFLLLEYLMRNAGKIVTRNMLLEHVWDSSADPATNTVDVHIKCLRDKIDKPFGTKQILTIHGLGYKLETTS